MTIKLFYFTDANEVPGKVYKVQSGVKSVYYSRSKGRIYSAAFSKAGRLYYVDANETAIYRVFKILWFSFAIKVYTHSTYVRDISFDRGETLYFSEASGAAANGKIYKFVDGSATLFREITLSSVGGFWAGDFAFDTQNTLYISSGNRIPSSIFRYENGGWTAVFTDKNEPIKGMAFLACDLLCYANWRSEIYLLDVKTGLRETAYAAPFHLWLSDAALFKPKINETTLYEGTKEYSCNVACWRDDGTVDTGWDGFFPDIDVDNADIQALLSDIGAPVALTNDDTEIWNRTRTVWAWIQQQGLWPGQANYEQAYEYRAALGHWPSIAEFAHMFVTWGGFWWGGCTCMCRAQTFATLLCRAGIPPDRMAIAETRWKPEYSQHMYVVLKIGCHWYYVDPSENISPLSGAPANVGSGSKDYVHPNNLILVPGSTLSKPMLVR